MHARRLLNSNVNSLALRHFMCEWTERQELEIDCWPPIAILPLGTGNDMARVLGWGGGYNNESLVELLAQVQRAHVVVVDRWALQITSGKGAGGRGATKARTVPFQNYFGVGVDAQVSSEMRGGWLGGWLAGVVRRMPHLLHTRNPRL